MEHRAIQATILILGGAVALVHLIKLANAWVTALEAATDTLAHEPQQDLGEFMADVLNDDEGGYGPDFN